MNLASISLSNDAISAIITMAVAIGVAFLVDRLVIGRGGRVAARIGDGGVSRAAQTRLRVVRRLVFVVILLIGAALALSRFDNFNRLATGILASSAVLTLIIGLAARQVLANPMAGILLAITQPIRIGDSVTIEDETGQGRRPHPLLHLPRSRGRPAHGRAEREGGDQRRLQSLHRRSNGSSRGVGVGAARGGPRPRALGAGGGGDRTVDVAEITADGVRIEVHGGRDPERTKTGAEEAKLRERAHEALREAGVLAQV